jgi:hypothetical protein
MDLLLRIERHVRARRIPPSRFGRDAMGDPQFLFDLRDGRVLQQRTISKLSAYLDRIERLTPEQDARPH